MLSFTTVLILELYKIHLDIESIIILTWKYPYYYVFFFLKYFIHFKIIDIIFNYN